MSRSLIDSRGYAPLSLDDADPDAVTRSTNTLIRLSRWVSLAMMLFLIAVIAFLAVTDPLTKWILTGTLLLMGMIVLAWLLRKRRR
jgi:L-asparagine transporter-like permease